MSGVDTGQVRLIARLVPKVGKEQALKDAITGMVPSVRKEPGCIAYAAHTDRERPAVIVMYEIWADRAALDAHIAAPSFVALEQRFDELLGEPLQIEHLVPLI